MAYDYIKERQEAIDAGKSALASLRLAKSDLNSAKNFNGRIYK